MSQLLDYIGPPLKLFLYIVVIGGTLFLAFYYLSPEFREWALGTLDKYLPTLSK